MAEDVLKIPGELDLDKKRAAVEHRRCILLALLACTSPNNPTLKKLLSNGLLVTVKAWLDDILSGAIGTLSLLSLEVSVKPLPCPCLLIQLLARATTSLSFYRKRRLAAPPPFKY
jgi:hypothetical protein